MFILEHFHDLFAHCDAIIWLRIGIILIISFFVVFIPVTVIFNFRWRIILFVYRTLAWSISYPANDFDMKSDVTTNIICLLLLIAFAIKS
jgi:hypothetical protein